MKLSDVTKMINDGGISCMSWSFPDKDSPLPYAVATKPRNGEIFRADNGRYYATMHIVLFLTLAVDDEETEYKMDEILNDNDINFVYEMYYAQEDAVCMKVYEFEVKED